MATVEGFPGLIETWRDVRNQKNPRIVVGGGSGHATRMRSFSFSQYGGREGAIHAAWGFLTGIALIAPTPQRPTAPKHDSNAHPFDRPERAERPSGTGKAKGQKGGRGKKRGSNKAEVLVLNALRSLDWVVRRGGVIDFVARRDGRMAWIEVKNQDSKDKLDAGQKAVLRHLRHLGAEEYVVDVWPSTGKVRVWTLPGRNPVSFTEVFGA